MGVSLTKICICTTSQVAKALVEKVLCSILLKQGMGLYVGEVFLMLENYE